MVLRQVTYVDPEGRKKIVLLPDSEPDEFAERGILVGPPNFEELELPTDIEIRLNNELWNRNILTPEDARRRRPEIISAIQSVLKLDAEQIIAVYVGKDNNNGS